MKETHMFVYLMNPGPAAIEWTALLGDKYRDVLPFKWSFTDELEKANVIAWDGMMTFKSVGAYEKAASLLKQGERVLLLHRDAYSLYRQHPYVSFMGLEQIRFIELASGHVLPEDLLWALTECHKKLYDV